MRAYRGEGEGEQVERVFGQRGKFTLPECCGLPGGAVYQVGGDCAYALVTGDAHGGAVLHASQAAAQHAAGNADQQLAEFARAMDAMGLGGIVNGHVAGLQKHLAAVLFQQVVAEE